ncbi:MAG TPA: nicotinate-nucleotide--dimethylbenzimidazole phosphoribosyltransferase [Rhodobacteraceae bacterium]|nr:nicotinate-nucleotide--dimethylbenzimidazole phosphoribosyltransferase [Paracoccaceae bacterium]
MRFESLNDIRDALRRAPSPDAAAFEVAEARNSQLTKPPGALGRLETLAIWMGAWQGTEKPHCRSPQVLIFAGNHGVTARGVSAFPAEVTAQMVANFQHGGAAINQLCKTFGAELAVHALSLETPTADFTQSPAMTETEFLDAFSTGWSAVNPKADLVVTGEMGIGNTTSAAAIACALFGGLAEDWVGRGTGVDDAGLSRKTVVVREGVALHRSKGDGLEILRRLGGRELAAMAGAISAARTYRIPVLLDGFICTAAAACLVETHPGALDHAQAAHVSAEQAHANLLAHLGKEPLLALGLRLGEGSGAALAIGIVQGAVACLSGMATFAEAGVSGG